jgi:hypothetical protein
LAWLTLFPLRGPFPQTAQNAIDVSWIFYSGAGQTEQFTRQIAIGQPAAGTMFR